VTQGMQIFAPGDVLIKVFNGRPVIKGDIISTTSVRRPPTETLGRETMFEEIFRGFLGAQPLDLERSSCGSSQPAIRDRQDHRRN